MANELSTTYDPSSIEEAIYQRWESEGLFQPQENATGKPYCIIMPPPNITGRLHMGHAMYVIQDILVRYHRMAGFKTLYLPGTDHASIATQNVIERNLLKEEKKTRHDIGREKFLEKAWVWKEQYGNAITSQLRKLGMSCDWSRERFTMDDHSSYSVVEAFTKLYEQGLLYKGDYCVHWCPRCATVLADDEIEHETVKSFLWHIRYPYAEGKGKIIVATTRPETMLGDTAVAIHPEDIRYKDHVGKMIRLPLTDREIPIISDDHVDPAFGTGAVKVTPAHDFNDYEMGKRHNLPLEVVIGFDNRMTDKAGRFAGMDALDARKKIEVELEEGGYLEAKEPHEHNVGHCYRCKAVVQPMVSQQWFVNVKPLAKRAIDAVKNGNVKIVPERFEKIYFQWLDNIRDWCVSRQLWWGHRIPAYYAADGTMTIGHEQPAGTTQDNDVLDTWFSSALWPFSTLGWPNEKDAGIEANDLATFFPTSVLETGHDIIFFWVARMVMMSLALTDKVPFDTVYLHGMVRNEKGQKMSKSLGTVIDPLDIIKEYGTDALRYSLISGVTPGNDVKFSTSKAEGAKYFCNKIWNASRFIFSNTEGATADLPPLESLTLAQRWIVAKAHQQVEKSTEHITSYNFSEYTLGVYHFFWHDLCDWYLELAKAELKDQEHAQQAKQVLLYTLSIILKLLHPCMPFISESIWQQIDQKQPLITAAWPTSGEVDTEALHTFDDLAEAITAIRTLRAEFHIPPSALLPLTVLTDKPFDAIETTYLCTLAKISEVTTYTSLPTVSTKALKALVPGKELFLLVGDMVDFAKERERIAKELKETEKRCATLLGQLENEKFVASAPVEIIEERKESLILAEERRKKLEEQLGELE